MLSPNLFPSAGDGWTVRSLLQSTHSFISAKFGQQTTLYSARSFSMLNSFTSSSRSSSHTSLSQTSTSHSTSSLGLCLIQILIPLDMDGVLVSLPCWSFLWFCWYPPSSFSLWVTDRKGQKRCLCGQWLAMQLSWFTRPLHHSILSSRLSRKPALLLLRKQR